MRVCVLSAAPSTRLAPLTPLACVYVAAGFVQLSQIESEKLLAGLVGDELGRRKANGSYSGKFASVCSFNGYEARSSLPTNFDCDYACVLARPRGCTCSPHGTRCGQVHAGPRGGHACPLWCHRLFSKRAVLEAPYVTVGGWCGSSIRDGGGGASDRRHAGRRHPANYRTSTPRVLASTGSLRVRLIVRVARAPQVDLADKPFRTLASIRPQLMTEELYINPGPIQFFGETADCRAKTLCLEESDYLDR